MRKKVLAVASGGGHLIQLLRLEPALRDTEAYCLTTIKGEVKTDQFTRTWVIKDASRNEKIGLLIMAVRIFFIVLKIRPDVVITTGAAPGILAIIISKVFKAKTMWIDSIANSEELSMSGVIALKYADVCMTQWPELTQKYPGLIYKGSVL